MHEATQDSVDAQYQVAVRERTQEFVDALRRSTMQGQRYARARRRWWLAFASATVILYLVSLGQACVAFWQDWQHGVWGNDLLDHSSDLLGTCFLLFGLLQFARMERREADAQAEARAWREAAIQGNDQLAPRANMQPGPLTDPELAISLMKVGPLPNPAARNGLALAAMAALLGLSGVGAIILFAVGTVTPMPAHTQAHISAQDQVFAAGLLAVGLTLLALAMWMGQWAWRMRRPLYLVADTSGLALAEGRRARERTHIAWHSARTFFVVKHMNGGVEATTYVLDADDDLLIWTIDQRTPAATQTASERLCKTIVMRTGLPLRAPVVRPEVRATRSTRARRATGPERIAGAAVPGTPASQVAGLPARRLTPLTVIVAMSLVSILLFAASGWGLQQFQTRLFQSYVARIHAERPLYHDALTHDDGQWPVHPPSASDGGYRFVNNSYEMTGGPENVGTAPVFGLTASTAQTYEDAAIEVTVRESYGVSSYGGIGLVLRQGSDQAHTVGFSIDKTGEWTISNFDFSNLDIVSGQNPAIHTGNEATNRLLVLMRGSQYICYVNDQLVGVFYNSAPQTNATVQDSHIALWLPDHTAVGSFSDFTIYPAVM